MLVVQTLAVGLTAFLGIEQARAATDYSIDVNQPGLESGWTLTIDGTLVNANIGAISLTPSGGPSIVTVSTDVGAPMLIATHTSYDVKSFATAPSAGLAPVWGADNAGATFNPLSQTYSAYDAATANAAIQNAAYLFDLHSSVLTGASLTDKAALQLAVWAALYDTGAQDSWQSQLVTPAGRFNVAGGAADAAARSQALNWLNNDLGQFGELVHQQYSGNLLIPNPLGQHEGVPPELLLPGLIPTPVPEPTTVLAGLLLLLPFGASALRFVRKHRVA